MQECIGCQISGCNVDSDTIFITSSSPSFDLGPALEISCNENILVTANPVGGSGITIISGVMEQQLKQLYLNKVLIILLLLTTMDVHTLILCL